MMQGGLTFPVLAEMLRSLFVEVAVNDILIDPKTRTDSRISLLSGVHRKEIRRLRGIPRNRFETPGVVTLATQVVGRWVETAPFIDADGRPRPLSRANPETAASASSFEAVVESVTADIHPRAILDDLLSHGVVFVDEADRVQLKAEAFIPRPVEDEPLLYFARNLHDHAAATVANIGAVGFAPFLDRSVHYHGLTAERAAGLRASFACAGAMRVLLAVNRWALDLSGSKPGDGKSSLRRVNFGVYVLDDDESPASDGTS